MDAVDKGEKKKNQKRGLISKTWERCKSISRGSNDASSSTRVRLIKKSKSWHGPCSGSLGLLSSEECRQQDTAGNVKIRKEKRKHLIAPEGCFSVYVGPWKQRFVVRTEFANHPLFRTLLEEAETEYGFSSAGPLELPCGVDAFCMVLMEMGSEERVHRPRRRCRFTPGGISGHGAYQLLSPSRMMAIN